MDTRDFLEFQSEPRDGILFETMLTPHQSLPTVGFLAVIVVFIGLSAAIGIGFTLVGAWPVIGFLGIDLLVVFYAFWVSYRSASQRERVRLSDRELEAVCFDGATQASRAILQPYWAKVALEPLLQRRSQLMIRSHGRALELGSFLGQEEKKALATTLLVALSRLRGTI
jgi:uncharacterized membrane protein